MEEVFYFLVGDINSLQGRSNIYAHESKTDYMQAYILSSMVLRDQGDRGGASGGSCAAKQAFYDRGSPSIFPRLLT